MIDLAVEFRAGLVAAHPLLVSMLGIGCSSAYKLLRDFETEFKRQRGVGLPRAGMSNAVMIDRDRFELLRSVRRDVESGRFPNYRDAVRYHLDPDWSLTADLGSVALQLQRSQDELALLRASLAESHALLTRITPVLGELLTEVRDLRGEVGGLRTLVTDAVDSQKW